MALCVRVCVVVIIPNRCENPLAQREHWRHGSIDNTAYATFALP